MQSASATYSLPIRRGVWSSPQRRNFAGACLAHMLHDGIICTGECYKKVVKLTFAKGASLKDAARLFNSSLDGNTPRAIDIHEGEEVNESAFKALIRQAVALNSSGKSKSWKKAKP
jgi:hypothetical protein